jgi:hypothetical protein
MKPINKIYYLCFLPLLLLLSCTTISQDVPQKELKAGERLYVGQIEVTLNGERAKKCEFYINSDIVPHLKTSSDLWIVYRTERESAKLSKIVCLHRTKNGAAAWHQQALKLKEFNRSENNQEITSFGKLIISWTVDENETLAKAQEQALRKSETEARIESSGKLKIRVTSNLQEAKNYYQTIAKNSPSKDYAWREALIEVE